MTDSIGLGVDRYEETSTQQSLLSIGRKLPRAAHSVTRGDEARTGADWLWEIWLGGASWLAIRFQAKRLLTTGRYDVGYRSGVDKESLQVDLLISSCQSRFIIPAYVFYSDSRADPWASEVCRLAPYNPPSIGAIFAYARDIKALVDASESPRRPDEIAPHARLWPCIISAYQRRCCKDGFMRGAPWIWQPDWYEMPYEYHGGRDYAGLAEIAALSLDVDGDIVGETGNPQNSSYVVSELPEYAQFVRDGRQFNPSEAFPDDVSVVTVLNQFPR